MVVATYETILGVADGVHEGIVAGAGLGQQGREGGDERIDATHVAQHTLVDNNIVMFMVRCSFSPTIYTPKAISAPILIYHHCVLSCTYESRNEILNISLDDSSEVLFLLFRKMLNAHKFHYFHEAAPIPTPFICECVDEPAD